MKARSHTLTQFLCPPTVLPPIRAPSATSYWLLPAVVVSNVPARTLLHGFEPQHLLWLAVTTAVWFALGVTVFNRGLRRYASASS